MRTRFDQLAKQIGQEALGRSGATVVHDEIAPEIQYADLRHEPDPARDAERKRLGLLGRIAARPCLIEVYSRALDDEAFRGCLPKHLAFWQQRARRARADNQRRRTKRQPPRPFVAPSLWIIAAGAPKALLARLELRSASGSGSDWPAGVYFFGNTVLRVGLVVASELPRKRSTVLVRLMAAGSLLADAIEDLGELRPSAPERAVAEHILVRLRHTLGKKPKPTREEQEFIVAMYETWAEAEVRVRAETRAEARAETKAEDVLTVFRVRGIAVTAAVRKRILAEKNLKQLGRWHEKAIVAASLEEVIGKRR
ncbi:MAG TPA: hypothetical protein VNO30_01170 [Kofleriaceae bacterium]|nr:hypothetical protein [Kofleriaceae bacterium]